MALLSRSELEQLMKTNYWLILLIIFGCLGSFDLFHIGYPLTHDGDVHLLRLTNFYVSLSEGIWIPRWAANVNWGYGQPVFEFFYPLPSYLGSLLHLLGLSFANSLKLLLGCSLLLSGCTMYLYLRQLTSRLGAFFGAFLYMFAPYRFVDIYVRGDVGESLALVFVPLVFYLMTVTVRNKNKYVLLLAGFSLALLILCHNIVSLMTLPFILFWGIYLWYTNKKTKQALFSLISIVVIGFILSAFFWIPGLFEAKYTLKDIVTKGEYASRFVSFFSLFYGSWSYGGSGAFTVQLGIIQWVVSIGSLCIILLRKTRGKFLISALLVYTLIAIFLMLPISSIIWSHILLLQNFQFPWRFLVVTIFSTAVLGGLFIDHFPKKSQLYVVIVCISICLIAENSYWHAKSYVSRPDSMFGGIFKGPSDTGESSPIWGIRFMESGYIHPLEVLDGNASILVGKRTTTRHEYAVLARQDTRLMENTLYFPGWHILVDGQEVPVEFQDELHRGIITFDIPQGRHTVSVIFTDTKMRKTADYISLLGFIMVCFLLLPLPKRLTMGL